MSNPWFRMYSDFIYNETIEFLSFEDQRHFVFLLCMKNEGLLDKKYPQPGMLDRVVSRRLGLIGEAFDNAKRRIKEVGLIDDNWQPVNWDERQFKSDTSKERTRAWRERQKSHSDVTVTAQETHTDSETKSETEIETHTAEQDNDLNPVRVIPTAKPGTAGSCCQVMIANQIHGCNPHNPLLLALIEAGATEDEFAYASREAVSKGNKKFGYVLGIVKGQREQAAKLILHKGRLPNKQEVIEAQNRAVASTWMPPELREKNHAG